MDIRIYDFNFNLLSIMSDIISSSWSIKYNGIGTYEGHFRLNDRISDIILSTPYLVLIEGRKQAVCTGKIADNELLVCGRTVNWLLSKRVIPPFKTKDIFDGEYQHPKTIIDYVLTKTFISPPQTDENGLFVEGTVDSRKAVTNFTILPYSGGEKLNRHFWRNSANIVDEVIHDLSEIMKAGYRLKFNFIDKTWDFEIINGSEKNLIMSEQNRNLYNVSYTEDIENYASGGWYEDTAQAVSDETSDTEQESIWRYIGFDDGNSGMQYWETVLGGTGLSEAQSSLSSKQIEYTVQGSVSRLKYEKDYNLGDIITVFIQFGNFKKKMRYKITGVNIWYNENSFGEEPVLKQIKEE